MKPTENDLRQIQRQEQRLRVFKEKMWMQNDGHDPINAFLLIVTSTFILAAAILIVGLYIYSKV